MNRYEESGLDNVWLMNGFHVANTPYGEAVSIEDVDGLHRLIAQSLIKKRAPLEGAELRFLRIEIGLSQSSLAALLGEQEQDVGNWERAKDKPLRGPIDRLVRMIYSNAMDDDPRFGELIDLLTETEDQLARTEQALRFERKGSHWAEAVVAEVA